MSLLVLKTKINLFFLLLPEKMTFTMPKSDQIINSLVTTKEIAPSLWREGNKYYMICSKHAYCIKDISNEEGSLYEIYRLENKSNNIHFEYLNGAYLFAKAIYLCYDDSRYQGQL